MGNRGWRVVERGPGPPPGATQATIDVGGLARSFWYVPGPQPDAPLVIALHGAGGQGAGMAWLTGLTTRAPAAGFAVAFPDGRQRAWNDGRSSARVARRSGVDGVAFLDALVGDLARRRVAAPDALYVCGISNGGFLTEHYAHRASPAQPVAVVMFHGTADRWVPFEGGPIGPLGRVAQRRAGPGSGRGLAIGALEVAREWAAGNSCAATPSTVSVAADLPVTRLTWPGAVPVVPHRIDGGGDTWPGGPQYLPVRVVGPVARNLDATGILVDFFGSARSADR